MPVEALSVKSQCYYVIITLIGYVVLQYVFISLLFSIFQIMTKLIGLYRKTMECVSVYKREEA